MLACLMAEERVLAVLARIEGRLDEMDTKLEALTRARSKSMEWIGQLSEHIESLDAFREEVRASFEPILSTMERLDEITRILRHATSDVSRRVESLERHPRRVS
ncbi:MAG: hypothetical protein AAF658_17620 [Myxococcota bacterium]